MKEWSEIYQERATNLEKGEFTLEKIAKEFLAKYVSIALKAYEEKGYEHAGPLENILGLVAEYTLVVESVFDVRPVPTSVIETSVRRFFLIRKV